MSSLKKDHCLTGQIGFTLLELLIVVVILSSLAAIAVPSFSSVGSQSTISAVQRNATIVQSALDRYAVEHGAYPDRALWTKRCADIGTGYGIGTGYTFLLNRMKLYSNREGEVCDSRRDGDYPLGPYLDDDIPFNTLLDSRAVLIYPVAGGQDEAGLYGWVYNSDNGSFVAR